MSGQHSPLPPSGAPCWGECSGWVMANAGKPDIPTPESLAGEAAHWVGAECLSNFQSRLEGLPLTCGEWIGEVDPNGTVVDEQMVAGAQVYVDDVLEVAQGTGGLRDLRIEYKVHATQIHDLNYGTLDTSMWLPDRRKLYIWDYKNGHRDVKAKGNLQLIDYIAGLVATPEISGVEPKFIEVILRIVHPFAYSANGAVDEWRIQLSDLEPYFEQLRTKAYEAFTDPKFTTGIHCRDCAAVGRCAARRGATGNLIDYVDAPYEIDTMTPVELATERQILSDGVKVAKERLEAIEADLIHRLSNGEAGGGLALETTSGHLEWTVPVEQAIILGKQFKADLAKVSVATPTQAKSLVPADMRPQFNSVLDSVTRRPARGVKLVDAADSSVARAFGRK